MIYDDKKIKFISDHIDLKDEEICKLFNEYFKVNVKPQNIKTARLRWCGRKNKTYTKYSEEHLNFLLENQDLDRYELVKSFNENFNLKKSKVDVTNLLCKIKKQREKGENL